MMKLKVKKGATVEVIAGAEKGKRGTVLQVNPEKMQVCIQGIRLQTHYSKQDGISKKEGFIHYSNVKLIEAAAPTKKKAAKKATKEKSA